METELKPCCGEVPQLKYFAGGIRGYYPYYEIKCAKCNSGVHVDIMKLTITGRDAARKHTITLWNRRFSDGAK